MLSKNDVASFPGPSGCHLPHVTWQCSRCLDYVELCSNWALCTEIAHHIGSELGPESGIDPQDHCYFQVGFYPIDGVHYLAREPSQLTDIADIRSNTTDDRVIRGKDRFPKYCNFPSAIFNRWLSAPAKTFAPVMDKR